MVNFLSLTATLSQILWIQKPGPRPPALAWLWLSPSGPAWPGFWPQAGAGTSLVQLIIKNHNGKS